jgi:hypothetical protein
MQNTNCNDSVKMNVPNASYQVMLKEGLPCSDSDVLMAQSLILF